MPEPKIAQRGPYVVEETPGRKAWCACGQSQTQPYCDGSHRRLGTGMRPVIVDIAAAGKVEWCGCKHSGSKPFCDGTHRTLPPA